MILESGGCLPAFPKKVARRAASEYFIGPADKRTEKEYMR